MKYNKNTMAMTHETPLTHDILLQLGFDLVNGCYWMTCKTIVWTESVISFGEGQPRLDETILPHCKTVGDVIALHKMLTGQPLI